MRVLGIDPGSAATGWALVVSEGNRYRLAAAGVLRTPPGERPRRLASLHDGLSEVVAEHSPEQAAVESPFAGRNLRSGLALAESRGVALAVLGKAQIRVTGYSPAQVKSAVVGTGRAEKRQVVYMVVRLLGLERPPAQDAADAMAVAITHIHLNRLSTRLLDPDIPAC